MNDTRRTQYDIFVSHSSSDTAAVKTLVAQWEAWGHHIFADFNDERLQLASRTGKMSPELSNYLRTTIQKCHIFVFIASQNSASSRWMPWELGLAHGSVGRVHLFLLEPAKVNVVAGGEYLHLYHQTTFCSDSARDYLRDAVEKARIEINKPAALEVAFLMGGEMAGGGGGLKQAAASAEQGVISGQGYLATPRSPRNTWDPLGVWEFWMGKRR